MLDHVKESLHHCKVNQSVLLLFKKIYTIAPDIAYIIIFRFEEGCVKKDTFDILNRCLRVVCLRVVRNGLFAHIHRDFGN